MILLLLIVIYRVSQKDVTVLSEIWVSRIPFTCFSTVSHDTQWSGGNSGELSLCSTPLPLYFSFNNCDWKLPSNFIGIHRTCCRALHCCTRSTCTRFCALGSAMGYSPVPVPVGSSTKSFMRPPSRGPPLRAICVWCIELARNLCKSWPSRRTQCSPLMPNSWWPSVRLILCVVSWWG